MEPLDNPVWHALTGPHASFAEGSSLALRYPIDVAPFSALPDGPSEEAWSALAKLVGPGAGAVLFRTDPVEIPDEWNVVVRMPTLQMIAPPALGEADPSFVALGPADADDMVALTAATKPGPFLTRTVELGNYLGARDDGRLVAMAGERMTLATHVEISAVCTDPNDRKRGLGTRLVRAVAAGIEQRGARPMLHVLESNSDAIRVYERLGFTNRAAFDVILMQAPS